MFFLADFKKKSGRNIQKKKRKEQRQKNSII